MVQVNTGFWLAAESPLKSDDDTYERSSHPLAWKFFIVVLAWTPVGNRSNRHLERGL